MKLLPKTIEGWNAKKRLFMRLLSKEPDPEQAEVYENAVNYCDRKIRQVHKAILVLLACLILAISGCNIMRETLHLGGAACQDAGWLLQKGADNIKTQEK